MGNDQSKDDADKSPLENGVKVEEFIKILGERVQRYQNENKVINATPSNIPGTAALLTDDAVQPSQYDEHLPNTPGAGLPMDRGPKSQLQNKSSGEKKKQIINLEQLAALYEDDDNDERTRTLDAVQSSQNVPPTNTPVAELPMSQAQPNFQYSNPNMAPQGFLPSNTISYSQNVLPPNMLGSELSMVQTNTSFQYSNPNIAPQGFPPSMPPMHASWTGPFPAPPFVHDTQYIQQHGAGSFPGPPPGAPMLESFDAVDSANYPQVQPPMPQDNETRDKDTTQGFDYCPFRSPYNFRNEQQTRNFKNIRNKPPSGNDLNKRSFNKQQNIHDHHPRRCVEQSNQHKTHQGQNNNLQKKQGQNHNHQKTQGQNDNHQRRPQCQNDSQPKKQGQHDHQPKKQGQNDHQPKKQGQNDHQPKKQGQHDKQPKKQGQHDKQPKKQGQNDKQPKKEGQNDNQPRKQQSHNNQGKERQIDHRQHQTDKPQFQGNNQPKNQQTVNPNQGAIPKTKHNTININITNNVKIENRKTTYVIGTPRQIHSSTEGQKNQHQNKSSGEQKKEKPVVKSCSTIRRTP